MFTVYPSLIMDISRYTYFMKCSEIFHSVYLPKEMFQESLEQFSWNLILRYTEKLTSMKYSERKLLSVSFPLH